MSDKLVFDDGILSDLKSKFTKKKKFNDETYVLYGQYSNSTEPHKVRAKLIEWAKKQSSPPLSRRKKPIVYDTTWHGKRYKLYIPERWLVHNV